MTQNAPQYNSLCRWGLQSLLPVAGAAAERVFGQSAIALVQKGVDLGIRHVMIPFMETHAGEVLKYGVELGLRTWQHFLAKFGWRSDYLDKVICHQVGAGHRDAVLKAIGVPPEKEFSTFEYLGNIGTVSLPITAAIAEEREFLQPGDRVGFLGIGSGLNCLMLGLEW